MTDPSLFYDTKYFKDNMKQRQLIVASVWLSLLSTLRRNTERIFIELMTSDRKLKASREGSK